MVPSHPPLRALSSRGWTLSQFSPHPTAPMLTDGTQQSSPPARVLLATMALINWRLKLLDRLQRTPSALCFAFSPICCILGMLCLCYTCAVLCHAMPYYAVLCHAVLCEYHAVLCCATLCYAMPYHATLCHAVSCYAVLCCAALCYDMPCHMLYCIWLFLISSADCLLRLMFLQVLCD